MLGRDDGDSIQSTPSLLYKALIYICLSRAITKYIVKLLLIDKGAKLNVSNGDWDNNMGLIWASYSGYIDTVQLFYLIRELRRMM